MVLILHLPEAQMFWLGHPAQADALPASSLWVPGQSTHKIKNICTWFSAYVTETDE